MSFILGFCKEGRVDKGFRMEEEMERMGMAPDVVTHNMLINECFQWRSGEEAFWVFEEMREKGLRP